ncbi:MAG: putative DNA binding domain-containing protein [Prevotella sp.]|nr:putative DNA binding domain-containing protein [Prevotella sp.]
MTIDELNNIIASDEDYRIERTISTGDMDKFQEAICAFANDMPGSRQKGYLLIGVKDNGDIAGLQVTDTLMKRISGIRSDGNILPLPMMTTEKVTTEQGDVLVVEVTPSFDTPVRYRGRTFIRIGPRRDIATVDEERILSERCASSLPTFDTRPCREATIDDIHTDIIIAEYLPKAIDPDVLVGDHRSLKEQLASLRLYNLTYDCPTYAAMIMFGRNPKYFIPGAYIQFVRFNGDNNGGSILNERRFAGCLYKILPELENFIRDGIVTKRPVSISILREKNVLNYPYKALRELLMNAVMHRDYQSNMPTRLYQYDNHIEIMNPGGLYGQARPENFPNVNDYRNSVIAEMMRTLNYVNMFNHGVGEVFELLEKNGSPKAIFNVGLLTAFSVVINEPEEPNLSQACHQLVTNLSPQVKSLIISLEDKKMSASELQLVTNLSPLSKRLFRKQYITPGVEAGLINLTNPDTPRHPKQKYYLTEQGMKVLDMLLNEKQK